MGVDAVLLTSHQSAHVTPIVTRVSCGATEIVPIFYLKNLVQMIKRLQEENVWFYGTSERAESTIYDHDYQGAVALVMGNEQMGLPQLAESTCDYLMKIPTSPTMVSLNVSVARHLSVISRCRISANFTFYGYHWEVLYYKYNDGG